MQRGSHAPGARIGFFMDLVETLCTQQRSRWLKGDRVSVDELIEPYPALHGDQEALLDLIYHEYLIREELGEPVSADEFCARYPAFQQQLARQFELRHAIESALTSSMLGQSSDARSDADRAARAAPRDLQREFPETKRFVVFRQLGAGAMGTVYAAYDRQWRQKVALKLLHRTDADSVARLKEEFRVVADLWHPNFVQLFELFSFQEYTFFTMEFVKGADFVAHCRREAEGGSGIDADALLRFVFPHQNLGSFFITLPDAFDQRGNGVSRPHVPYLPLA